VTSSAAGQPPFALDGTVTRDKLLELLAVQTELPELDYKRECNLSSAGGLVELTKDIGAMSILGGYLGVGADDSGNAVGLPDGQAWLFDQATLSAKIAKYLPNGVEIRSAVHELDHGPGLRAVALVWVGPHSDGWCVFTRTGDYVVAGKTKLAFRAGDVYARHGTRSEPWNQTDIAAARSALVARAKDSWRAEHAAETRRALHAALSGVAVAAGPSAAFTWQLDRAGFEAAAVELLRRDDDVPVRLMLRSAAAEAQRLVLLPESTGATDLVVVLDRIAGLAALGLDLRRSAFMSMAVRTLLDVYGWAVDDLRVHTSAHGLTPVLWLRVAERLYALGALAIRLQAWPSVRELALAPVPALVREQRRSAWHRDALTQASRARLFTEQQPDGRTRELSLLLFARAAAAADPILRPDLPGDVSVSYAGPDPLLDSLCQFDLLVTVVSGVAADATTSGLSSPSATPTTRGPTVAVPTRSSARWSSTPRSARRCWLVLETVSLRSCSSWPTAPRNGRARPSGAGRATPIPPSERSSAATCSVADAAAVVAGGEQACTAPRWKKAVTCHRSGNGGCDTVEQRRCR